MARLVILMLLCVLPALATARFLHHAKPFVVQGRIYCDTCRAGFETSATTYIPGARVRIECRDRKSLALTYSIEGVTDSTGTYKLTVADDHLDEACDAMLVSSPDPLCSEPNAGHDKSRVILTRSNGMPSDLRFANNMGFLKSEPMTECTQVLQMYKETEDED